MQEWEATRLLPIVTSVLTSKNVPSDLKQTLNSALLLIDGVLSKHKYVIGVRIFFHIFMHCYKKKKQHECASVRARVRELVRVFVCACVFVCICVCVCM